MIKLMFGDCLEKMGEIESNSVDSIVTDPPAGISFMGKEWDHHKGGRDEWIKWMQSIAIEALRVIKPGGHALVWTIPRTSHWTATAWENAGFEVRDSIAHVFGSGFPKSANISKNIDKAAGAERKVISEIKTKSGGMAHISKTNAEHGFRPSAYNGHSLDDDAKNVIQQTEPATNEAKQWDGWGTALKPAREDWLLLRKPLGEKTIAANVLKYGAGAINIDKTKVLSYNIKILLDEYLCLIKTLSKEE